LLEADYKCIGALEVGLNAIATFRIEQEPLQRLLLFRSRFNTSNTDTTWAVIKPCHSTLTPAGATTTSIAAPE
jgi:hypothetical protein